MLETKRTYFCIQCGDIDVERSDGNWSVNPLCPQCVEPMEQIPILFDDPLDFDFPESEHVTSREDKMERRKDLRCSYCRPHKGENATSYGRHGKGKPKGKK